MRLVFCVWCAVLCRRVWVSVSSVGVRVCVSVCGVARVCV